ncbi:hypothetical protein Lspi_2508 [Legionella spiritensis]|uniref:Uncharacterized protein n=1 Tax=Legionella spiritensis TaxID=452 RepID=A0A0W0YZE6_LEGSP|nr:hypothetical protein Lspi_2508 [Legionella spiritensis]SNV45471.1 Uncharacterised protein [Legionella spiritensis]
MVFVIRFHKTTTLEHNNKQIAWNFFDKSQNSHLLDIYKVHSEILDEFTRILQTFMTKYDLIRLLMHRPLIYEQFCLYDEVENKEYKVLILRQLSDQV